MVDVRLDRDLVDDCHEGKITPEQAIQTQMLRNQEAFIAESREAMRLKEENAEVLAVKMAELEKAKVEASQKKTPSIGINPVYRT